MEATLTVKLPDTLRRQARSVAAQRGQTISEIVRRALQQYVEEAQVEGKTLVAMYAEFAEEDRQLAQAGLTHYAHVLAQEEAQA
jgi:predicted transcriptional regulator